MPGLFDQHERKRRAWTLAGLAVGSILLWQTYWGSLLLYPFTILATWFHEMGHGLAAILAGGRFEQLAIYADGSGVAQSLIPADASVFSHAFVSATAAPISAAPPQRSCAPATRRPRARPCSPGAGHRSART